MPAFDPRSNQIIIFGGGGQGRVLVDLIRAAGVYQLAGVVDDGLPPGSDVLGAKVLGGAVLLPDLRQQGYRLAANAVGGIGNVDVRLKVFGLLHDAGFECPNLVHPTAFIEPSAMLEGGVQVLAKTYISSAAVVGFGTLINAGVIVSHDCRIGRCVNLSPGAALAGGVTVEDYAQIGMNATVNVGVRVGSRCIIGNGATIKGDVPPGMRVRAGHIHP